MIVGAPNFEGWSEAFLYMCDNGRLACGKHLGMTAKATGVDLDGDPVVPINASTVPDTLERYEMIAHGCEDSRCHALERSLCCGVRAKHVDDELVCLNCFEPCEVPVCRAL